jgi:predicted PurR-regulated permease PerM
MSDLNSSATSEVRFSNRQIFDLTIQLVVGAVFVIASYRILQPFIDVIVAGGVIAIAVYPLFVKMVDRLGGRRKTVVALFALLGLGLIIVPAVLASSSLFETAQSLSEQVEAGTVKVPPPPSGVRDWPVIGADVNGLWQAASTNLQSFVNTYHDQMADIALGMVSAVAGVGAQALKFIFCILISAIFLVNAEACAAGLDSFSRRLFGGGRGIEINQLAAQTVRSVATGVLGVAFVQAFLAGVGMAVADVPWVGAWSLAILLLAIVQLPPLVILLPVAVWVLGSADNQIVAWGFLVWAILVGVSDTFLKPMFLGRGVDIPMIVILLGAIGGAILSGVMGLFVGAVILALAYRLLVDWLDHAAEEVPAVSPETAR